LSRNMVAIVTGAGKGIGRAIAVELARQNIAVVVNYRKSRQEAEQVLQEIENSGGQAIAYQASVSDPEQIESMVRKTVDTFGGVDYLVNNAGILFPKYLMFTKEEDWNETMRTNATGPFYMIKAVMRFMIEQRYGRIVNISSVAGDSGLPGQAAYAASKSAVNGLTRVLSKELARYNIHVNSIAPGYISTEMIDFLDEQTMSEYIESIPLKRLGLTEDVANLVSFLISGKANYITGQVIAVDGGLSV
jgi:3-oxoacyl-[acyl-carrier protein] reductase